MKPKKYCTRLGQCEGCELADETSTHDCAGNLIAYCPRCGGVLGVNVEDCQTCWEYAYPGFCFDCGRRIGRGLETCDNCRVYHKEQRDERVAERAMGK